MLARTLPRGPVFALLTAAAASAVTGCGEKASGPKAHLTPAVGGNLLVLRGTPREQGRQQGTVLRAQILALHEAWQRDALARDGDLLSPQTKERRAALLRLVDEVSQRLPEAARQELEGLSEACGLPTRTLLLTEVMTDLLRFTEPEPPLLGGRLAWNGAARRARLDPEGRFAGLLLHQLLWIAREGAAGAPTVTVLAWPGSLGGLIAVRRDGLALLAHQAPLELGRQGLAGVPFGLGLRLALERAATAPEALAALPRTTAHRVLAVALATGEAQEALLAMTGEDPTAAAQAETEVEARPQAFGVGWMDDAAVLLYWNAHAPRAFRVHRVP